MRCTGDFGLSLREGRKVSSLIRERLPATLELSFVAAVLAIVVGVPAGVYTALRRRSWLAQALLTLSLLGVSLPTFLIGILLILVFCGAARTGCRRTAAAQTECDRLVDAPASRRSTAGAT